MPDQSNAIVGGNLAKNFTAFDQLLEAAYDVVEAAENSIEVPMLVSEAISRLGDALIRYRNQTGAWSRPDAG